MSYTLSKLITAINASLNYPAITYDDVSHFLDACVAEINTTLHTSLRSFDAYVRTDHDSKIARYASVSLAHEPSGEYANVPCVDDDAQPAEGWNYWVRKDDHPERYRRFVRVSNGEIDRVQDLLYGVYVSDGVPKVYEAHAYSDALCLWVESSGFVDVDVTEFLPEDWITLFVIPYVCFKYTVRDGGSATTFAEDMEQGFQQLQESYDVPPAVTLSRVAGLPAYAADVSERLDKGWALDVKVGTRAILDCMKHARAVGAKFGSVYDAGGWGL